MSSAVLLVPLSEESVVRAVLPTILYEALQQGKPVHVVCKDNLESHAHELLSLFLGGLRALRRFQPGKLQQARLAKHFPPWRPKSKESFDQFIGS